jgi:aldose 1-epimerase
VSGAIREFQLESNAGAKARLIDYGATLVSLEVPDRNGRLADVVLGFDDPERYRGPHPHFGSTVGRYANRIAGGLFELDGRQFELAKNAGPNHLHGGAKGFDRAIWNAEPICDASGEGVVFRYRSEDCEEGYPGNLDVAVRYRLTHSNELWIDYKAHSDATTIVNLTHHSYFNLSDCGASDILGHRLLLRAHQYLPVDETAIPTGELAAVGGTPMDFREMRAVGSRIDEIQGGYDHNFVLDKSDAARSSVDDSDAELTLAAIVSDPHGDRVMEVHTSEPGIQFYTSNSLTGELRGKNDTCYRRHAALCLETQHFPDSPNRPAFPSTRLEAGARYSHTTVHRFS